MITFVVVAIWENHEWKHRLFSHISVNTASPVALIDLKRRLATPFNSNSDLEILNAARVSFLIGQQIWRPFKKFQDTTCRTWGVPCAVFGTRHSNCAASETECVGYRNVGDRCLHKITGIMQTTFSNVFCWMKIIIFWFNFYWNLFLRVLLTKSPHWLR